jgi:putative hydroxymethylpyrimidine transporter CytX
MFQVDNVEQPEGRKTLGFFDQFALWSSLGVGLLVLNGGALLVPALSLGEAIGAIIVGTVIGSILLGFVAWVGARQGKATMALLRPVLGNWGSTVPSFFNIVQLVGWGAFEILVMAQVADTLSRSYWGWSNLLVWKIGFALIVTLMAVGGPLVMAREWLGKYAIWAVYASTLWITWYLLTNYNLGKLLARTGEGGMSFWTAVDLVVAMPISWLPLVADYARFSTRPRQAFWGTSVGFALTNAWFFTLGAFFILAHPTDDIPTAILALSGGGLALLFILIDETDNAFADIYSAAVSLHNIWAGWTERTLAALLGFICFLAAVIIPQTQYETFLLLIGSFFVPLFGLLAADTLLNWQKQTHPEASKNVAWGAVGVWLLGIISYQAISRWLPEIGASLPSFLITLVLQLGNHWVGKRVTFAPQIASN